MECNPSNHSSLTTADGIMPRRAHTDSTPPLYPSRDVVHDGGAGCVLYVCAVHSGLVMGLAFVAEDAMVTACWTGSNLEGFIKALKFIELTTFNMFALTNLAMCVNLVLIVSVSGDHYAHWPGKVRVARGACKTRALHPEHTQNDFPLPLLACA